jgi:hypothetical protein
MGRILVHRIYRRAHLFIRQREEPPNPAFGPLRQVQPQGLNQHHVREVLRKATLIFNLFSENA